MNIVSDVAIFSSQRQVFGLPVCDLDWSEAFSFVSALAEMPIGQTVISFLNAHNANIMLKDPVYRQGLHRHLVLPDGVGVDMASLAAFGRLFPANLNGTDFVPALLTYMTKPKRVGLIGARPGTLAKARQNFERHAPWHEFIAIHDGFFDDSRSPDVTAEIASHKVDILLVAMGTPRQEKWIESHIRPEHARLVIGVGALFDFVAGEVPRAPEAYRKLRMEWMYRFMQEPRRLAGRYFIGGPIFAGHVVAHAAGARLGGWARTLRGAWKRPRDSASLQRRTDRL
ncbi:MAG: glycosyltransferase, WecB/TagA/CpsF family protein [Rhizobium sp.]|nr:glycosyltransferase, WecB/TagA/CpsF family protein [Rhizobium sp.]